MPTDLPPTSTSTPVPLPTATATPVSFTVDVPANVEWFDTEIEVKQGQRVVVSASGIVNTWDGRDIAFSDPDGQTENICVPTDKNEDCLINGERYGLLVGRIGNGEPLVVGGANDFIAPESGTIYLAVNDNSTFFFDNLDSFVVVISFP